MTANQVFDRTEEMASVHREFFGADEPAPTRRNDRPPLSLSDEDLLGTIRHSRQTAKFDALWRGDTEAYGGDDSAADLALCGILAFYSDSVEQVDRIFRSSALMRPKWDSPRGATTYGSITVEKATAGQTEHYEPNGRQMNGSSSAYANHAPRNNLGTHDDDGDHNDRNQDQGHRAQHEPTNVNSSVVSLNLPEEFWTKRKTLQHIRQAAHSRNRSADGVLHVTLARTAAFMNPERRIDTGVGSPANLNFFSTLIGPAGSGKSDDWAIGLELLPTPEFSEGWLADNQPLGSGEGLAEAYMGTVEVPSADPKKKPTQVRQQVRSNAFFFADEGESLTRLLERSGATVGESLRRAWKGTPLGQRNGTAERTRLVTDYAMGLIIGFQRTTVLPLLDDVSSGTPQRFLYASAKDPSIPDEPAVWPGPLSWNESLIRWQPWTLDPAILIEIRAADLARAQGREDVPPYDAHALLSRVKVASLLAAMEKRSCVTLEDWSLAKTVWQTSCAVRDSLLADASAQRQAKEVATNHFAARKQVVIEDTMAERAMGKVEDAIVSHVRKHAEAKQGCSRTALGRAGNWRDKRLVNIDEAIDRAVAHERVEMRGNRYWPGKSAR